MLLYLCKESKSSGMQQRNLRSDPLFFWFLFSTVSDDLATYPYLLFCIPLGIKEAKRKEDRGT